MAHIGGFGVMAAGGQCADMAALGPTLNMMEYKSALEVSPYMIGDWTPICMDDPGASFPPVAGQ